MTLHEDDELENAKEFDRKMEREREEEEPDDLREETETVIEDVMTHEVYFNGLVNDSDRYDLKVKLFDLATAAEPVRSIEKRINDWLQEVDEEGDLIPKSIQNVTASGGIVMVWYLEDMANAEDEE